MVNIVAVACLIGKSAFGFVADTPVSPDASPETQSLLTFLSDIYGRKTLSGQQEGWRGTNEFGFELNYIRTNTGKLPAILGLDLMPVTLQNPPRDHDVVKRSIDWYQRNGIVTICWHWHAPMGKRSFYSKETDFDLRQALIEGTPEHAGILRDIDSIAAELKLLQDAHVPVLWRPLHEANGRWFWWGAHGAEPYRKLWRLLFNRLTAVHHLHNLIWVFSPGASIDLADWYPGDAYVDIVGLDHYPMDGNHRPATDVFNELVAFSRGTKLVGMSENGPIPDPELAFREKANWLFFITWSGSILTGKNPTNELNQTFNHPQILNLGDLPSLKDYPAQKVETPFKLAFPASPGPVAVNGFRRTPLTVLVQDRNGRTIRNKTYNVSIALSENHSNAELSGTLTQPTLNGVATFEDVRISKPIRDCQLIATAEGLQRAESEAFEVGPGNGLVREWWNNNISLNPADDISTPPSGREPMRKALEIPFTSVINYSTRLRGWLLPPVSGAYTFWIASGSASKFWLSTDSSPSHCVQIAAINGSTPYAKWPHTNEAESKTVHLEAGERYYLEIRQRQQFGSTHLNVRWRLPDGSEQRPIPAERLASFTAMDESEPAQRAQ
ncbi:MAG TPA: glycosyl hydrolase [Verrucomicrobiae bacterium]|nr:glycosyl hydrolase [Verrucomicrobiae bacterium]